MSRFQNRLFAVRHSEAAGSTTSPIVSAPVENPFTALDRAAFRGLANRLNVNTLFVAKLRDRQIDLNTMTTGFRKRVADELGVLVWLGAFSANAGTAIADTRNNEDR